MRHRHVACNGDVSGVRIGRSARMLCPVHADVCKYIHQYGEFISCAISDAIIASDGCHMPSLDHSACEFVFEDDTV